MGDNVTDQSRNVFPNSRRLTETDFRAAVADTVRKLVRAHGIERVALEAGCDVRTITGALSESHSIKAATLFNLLALDLTALDGLAGHFGGHVVPVETSEGPGLSVLADTAKLLAIHGAALSDGRIDHQEAAVLRDAAKPVVQAWAAFGAKAVR